MMGLRGAKGGNEIDCLSLKSRRRVRLKPAQIRAAKRSYSKRVRKMAKIDAMNEVFSLVEKA